MPIAVTARQSLLSEGAIVGQSWYERTAFILFATVLISIQRVTGDLPRALHPRGLLLASELLEKAKGKGERLNKGYYAQLIEGLATAHDLKAQLGVLDRG